MNPNDPPTSSAVEAEPRSDTGRRADTALVLLGGDALVPSRFEVLPRHAVVIAADSGVDQAHRLGLDVDVAIGDFDSVSVEGLERATRRGADVHRHTVDKDATDFELALEAALALGVASVVVLGGEGGRLDHLIANALVLASPRFDGLALTALGSSGERIHVVRQRAVIAGEPGEIVSLLAVNGPATDVRTDGLRYPLDGDQLDPGSSRGVSNQLIAARAEVTLSSGVLLAVLPGPSHTPTSSNPVPLPAGDI